MKKGRGRPKLPDDERRQTLNIRLKPETIQKLKEIGPTAGQAAARLLEMAIHARTAQKE